MLDWIKEWSVPITLASVGLAVFSVWGLVWVIVRLPADHFLHTPEKDACQSHPALYAGWLLGKNLLGLVLLALGIVMLVTPGQGLLCILVGISLCDFPYKQELIWKILRRRTVQRSLNWIRRRAHKEPLKFPNGVSTNKPGVET